MLARVKFAEVRVCVHGRAMRAYGLRCHTERSGSYLQLDNDSCSSNGANRFSAISRARLSRATSLSTAAFTKDNMLFAS